jgi:hypothetical protein
MHRRHFLRRASGALLVLPFGSFLVQACYGTGASNGDAPAAPPTISGSSAVYTSNIDGGHSHTFTIALVAFTSPIDTQGQTSNDEGHTHSVAIAAADLQNVQTGQTVKVTTGNTESHTHVLTLVKVA